MNEKKGEFFGALNAAISHLEIANAQLLQLWNDGELRLTSIDLEKIDEALQKVVDERLKLEELKRLFTIIALRA